MNKIILILLLNLTLFASRGFLMPDEAFKPSAIINKNMQIEAEIMLANDIYLYADKITFELLNNDTLSITNIDKPQKTKHHDEIVYLQSPKFTIHLQNSDNSLTSKDVTLKISYQGCSSAGLCYEPLSKEFTLKVEASQLDTTTSTQKNTPIKTTNSLSETDSIADTLNSANIFIVLITFFGFGLLLSLTPCVFPMVPIISGLIISQGKNITTSKALSLSIVYVLSMAIAYTVAGVLAGLFGSNLQIALQTPWVIYSFSAIFVALALSMFGLYELKLPNALVKKVSSKNNHTGYVGVAVMGFLSALIVGPCVAAPLAGALVYIGQTGDAILGGMALFSMSIGMGIPLIAIGVSAGKFMPKPGEWMNIVSAIFGVMMLGVAIWMLERVVDSYITMLLYGLLGLSFATYLRFLKGSNFIKCSIVIIIFIYSIALFVGALSGSKSMTQPLSFITSTKTIKTDTLSFTKVHSIEEVDKLLKQHKGKKIILDFSAEWCVSCKELEEITFADEKVKNKMKEFVLIKADITAYTAEEKDLSKKYGVFGPPVLVFFNKNSTVIKSKTIVGFIEPSLFLQHLNSIQ